jgi:glycosyltransferase involved in cell wall biosynthesis
MAIRVSVVVPNLHSPMVDQTLDSIRRQSVDLARVEVIVVGQDGHAIVRNDELVTLVGTPEPVPPARARNIGLARAVGDIVVFIDADCIAAADWLVNLLAAYTVDPQRTVVGGAVGFASDNYWTLADNLSTFYRFLPFGSPGERPHLPSLNFSARRTALESVGGFKEDYPLPSGEDTDLCLRLRQAGHMLYFEPRAVVHHRPPRQSLGALLRHARNFGRYTPRMRPEARDLLGWPEALRQPAVLLALSPVLATGVTLRIFARRELWPYWRTAPAIYLAKLAWCLGAAEAGRA